MRIFLDTWADIIFWYHNLDLLQIEAANPTNLDYKLTWPDLTIYRDSVDLADILKKYLLIFKKGLHSENRVPFQPMCQFEKKKWFCNTRGYLHIRMEVLYRYHFISVCMFAELTQSQPISNTGIEPKVYTHLDNFLNF